MLPCEGHEACGSAADVLVGDDPYVPMCGRCVTLVRRQARRDVDTYEITPARVAKMRRVA